MTPPLPTCFLPAERASQETVLRQWRCFEDAPLVFELLNAVPNIVLVLNEQRQIVFSNRVLLDVLGVSGGEAVLGLRPGEALDCVHAHEPGCGCGTMEFCPTCGAAQAILSGLHGRQAAHECRIVQQSGAALDLRVCVTPLSTNGESFLVFAAEDISHEKRRQVLERLFFHDILNLAGVIMGYAELLSDPHPDQAVQITQILSEASRRLVEEIEAQRAISAAESGDLVVRPSVLRALDILQSVRALYGSPDVARDRRIAIAGQAHDARFISDRVLLERVLGNMVKNALEACAPGQTVTLSCRADDQRVSFEVHSPTFVPREVQLQIFQRSFSTKGSGRGLGTYSMKLLSERYLRGTVTFTTSPEHGTTFSAAYPLVLDSP
ncbi:MAG TPA: HAMP domain-containing sensor histidine kinase [Aggregatilineaceae bacterium]|nr:HAMP domain-containing sensor histidine kinase [Aggregatilineaceae bacterium]